MAVTFESSFKEIVENIFNRWTALKMAVEHGMAGQNGHTIAIEIMNYIYEFCIKNEGISQHDVEECLEEIMEQEFETICEDGSIREMSVLLVKYLKMLQEGKVNEIQFEFSQLPPAPKWLCPGVQVTYTPIEDSSDDDNDDMQEPIANRTRSTEAAVQNSMTSADVDPEWTTVKSRRKK